MKVDSSIFFTFISTVWKVLTLTKKVVNKSCSLLNYLQRSQWWHPFKSISLLVNREKPENSSTSKIVNNFRKNTFLHYYFRRMCYLMVQSSMPNFKRLSIIVFVEMVTIRRIFFIFTILTLRKKFVTLVAVAWEHSRRVIFQ